MKPLRTTLLTFCLLTIVMSHVQHRAIAQNQDSLRPFTAESVPGNVLELWKDVDTRKDPLETETVREWIEDGVVCRYVIFKVGTFKGTDSRIAAFYTFPEGAEKVPAIVWAHGGGQRAELSHGKYFAQQGYAMVDINWGGRSMMDDIKPNTDWGALDPSQGPKFYPGAKRKGTKVNLQPDEFTLDPVVSPRNGNWYMLAYAGRRAITFLEQQPQVDPSKIGFTGYSMGGNITSYVSIDPRLKAVVPMVGGAGFITADSPGVAKSGMSHAHRGNVNLFADTMESQSYYPHTKCPVMLLSASDDFHARFEFIYQCMNALPHDNWRVSQNMHFNHNLGAEQWILINRWFDKYLKGHAVEIPQTATTELSLDTQQSTALLKVTPDQIDDLVSMDVYYSHDPNPKSRFWIHVDSTRNGEHWTASLPVREKLPLFAFANCGYSLDRPSKAYQGTASTYTLTSTEAVHLPDVIQADFLSLEAKPQSVFSDIQRDGFRDWGFSTRGGMTTYKFRDPRSATPAADAKLKVTVSVPKKRLSYRFRITKNKYITGVSDKKIDYSFAKNFGAPSTEAVVLISASDFTSGRVEKIKMLDWTNISTLGISVYDAESKTTMDFKEKANRGVIVKLEWVDP